MLIDLVTCNYDTASKFTILKLTVPITVQYNSWDHLDGCKCSYKHLHALYRFLKRCQNLFAFVSLKASAVWKNFQIAIEKVNKYRQYHFFIVGSIDST